MNNVSFLFEKIIGHSVTIAGKTFMLFFMDASMNLKLGQNVQAKSVVIGKQVKIQ